MRRIRIAGRSSFSRHEKHRGKLGAGPTTRWPTRVDRSNPLSRMSCDAAVYTREYTSTGAATFRSAGTVLPEQMVSTAAKRWSASVFCVADSASAEYHSWEGGELQAPAELLHNRRRVQRSSVLPRPFLKWAGSKATYSSTASFSCRVRSVHDGDTFRCSDCTRVRLSSIDAPEMPGACQPGRHCAPGDPYVARDVLRGLISSRTVQCQAVGTSYDRVVAWCSVGGVDLSRAMVSGGYAICLPKFDVHHRLCR